MSKTLEQLRPAELFTRCADEYAKSRPTYPTQAIEFVLNKCSLTSGCAVADVGCGTGISARQFAQRELKVTGIDPNEQMRRQAESEPGSSLYPITFRSGCGEHTGLANASVNAVVAAQSFHWFKPKEAFREFHRILTADGWIVVMDNRHDESDAFTAETMKLIRSWPGTDTVEKIGGSVEHYLSRTRFFSYEGYETFHNSQTLSEEGLVTRFRSNPFFPKDEASVKSSIHDLNQIFAKYAVNSEVHLQLTTYVWFARRVETFGESFRKLLGLK